jgi:hypothetical protein
MQLQPWLIYFLPPYQAIIARGRPSLIYPVELCVKIASSRRGSARRAR